MGDALITAYEVERVLFRLALAVFVWKLLSEAWGAWRARPRPMMPLPATWPVVTVQIPLRNERLVAERVIRAVAALDYPHLEIQVLDDSDDETVAIVDRVVAELRAGGTAIEAIRRARREGAKAGALAHGLATARGELVAIFDADFMPQPGFLRRLVPYFASDPKIGMVQGRWQHVDREYSPLTRAQALVLDGLMLVEQPAKRARDQPLHFNGTAGMWRVACIADAGGWSGLSIVEDAELSYRAARRGWRMIHVPDLAVPAELPRTMRAYRVQQQRWTRGNAEVFRASWGAVLRAELPLRHRLLILLRCSSRSLYLFLVLLTIGMPLTTFGIVHGKIDYTPLVDAAVFGTVLLALYAYYLPAHHRATGSTVGAIGVVPLAMALHIGLSLSCAISFVAGLLRRPTEFVRTPKRGDGDAAAKVYELPIDRVAVIEVAIGLAYVAFTALALHRDLVVFAGFFALWAAAHLWTGLATILR